MSQRGRGLSSADAAAAAHDAAVALTASLAAEDRDAPAFPTDLVANVRDVGGEVSASVEETNRLRAALGLKPLKEGSSGGGGRGGQALAGLPAAERAALAAQAKSRADAVAAEALAARVAAAREARRQEAQLRGTAGLGEGEDDAWAWVQKSRAAAAKAAKAAAARTEAQLAEQEAGEEEEEGGAGAGAGAGAQAYGSAHLAGLTMDAQLAQLPEGQEVVLTLKDSRVLDDADDELENVRLAELRNRERARRAARKRPASEDEEEEAAPLPIAAGGIPPPPRAVLPQYESAAGPPQVGLGAAVEGAAEAARAARQAAVRARLQSSAAAPAPAPAAEAEAEAAAAEAAAAAAPKKMRKKAKRPKGHGRTVTADELVPLEEAEAAGGDHGARGGAAAASAAAARAADGAWGRFEAAKARAAAESAARIGTLARPARADADADADADAEEDEGDRELAAALGRARRAAGAAPAGGLAALAAGAAARRAAEAGGGGGGGGAVLTDTQEFVRTLNVERAKARAEEVAASGIVLADAAAGEAAAAAAAAAAPAPAPAPAPRRQYRQRSADDGDAVMSSEWAAASAEAAAEAGAEAADAAAMPPPSGGAADLLGGGGASRGLAGTLALLKEKGSLTEGVKWAGRNTDKKPMAVAGAVEAAAIATADAEWSFDFKLDRFDEFGRKMTPKEAFRELCHKFHGIFPSRSKQEARLKQWHEEQAALKVASGDTPLEAAAKMREAQRSTATPFVVLSGRVSSAQVTDAASRYATSERDGEAAPLRSPLLGGGGGATPAPAAPAPAPALGGGALPLEGVEKVRFLLGRQPQEKGKRARGQ